MHYKHTPVYLSLHSHCDVRLLLWVIHSNTLDLQWLLFVKEFLVCMWLYGVLCIWTFASYVTADAQMWFLWKEKIPANIKWNIALWNLLNERHDSKDAEIEVWHSIISLIKRHYIKDAKIEVQKLLLAS